ncbi:UDP-glucose--hexose-1-phosphate uridylyltransferase [Heyndrickxia sp. NPDC080065]|uniref:UDP-glucose--hexose-1-phosphate uridylyltransferase n=1 Tax=Heyndrickxia sp. NPDC080065 TaxID=3390568 RepID=UPI003CFC3B5A
MNIFELVQRLVDEAQKLALIEKEDMIYARNQVLSLLQLHDFKEMNRSFTERISIPDLLDEIVEYACEQELIEDYLDEKEIFSSKLMNCFITRPSDLNRLFYEKYNRSPKEATDFFYELSKNSNYIQTKRIAKNIEYKVDTKYVELDITINLSKPEKDPKQIEKEKNTKSTDYPTCLLCVENEGYAGRIGYPARSNHRVIQVELEEEKWYLQYSPYVYYREHCILLSEHHRKMKINRDTFSCLLAFVDRFPHYFIGSNADIPIVGGSILSHDHYQGGCYEFPMAKAKSDWTFDMTRFSGVKGEVIHWPMAVIRLKSNDRHKLIDAADYILTVWKEYSDETVGIRAYSNETPHNTITPISRKHGDVYELDLVLRNNRTNEEHPLGIFHPHADVHHIKKENIGLIEVMGLAVLPARLKDELVDVEKFLLNEKNDLKDYHRPWAMELKEKYAGTINHGNVESIVKKEVGSKFQRVLEDASVFKRDDAGRAALHRFIECL